MGAKDYDFADEVPAYREKNRMTYNSNTDEKTRKRRVAPKSSRIPGGIRQRRNKHMSW